MATIAITTVYSVLRYNVFKGVPWSQVPLFVMNKSVAWSSIILLAIASWEAFRNRQRLIDSSPWAMGAGLALVHVVMSLPLLIARTHFPDFFVHSMHLRSGIHVSMWGGAMAMLCLWLCRRWFGAALLAPVAVVLHVSLIGARNWLHPADWPGHMVPVSLWSVLAAAVMAAGVMASLERRFRYGHQNK